MSTQNVIETDVLVIGGGIAGCFAAIKAREKGLDVTIVDKAFSGKSGASISAPAGWLAYNPEWDLDFDAILHAMDVDGEYINHREWCDIILRKTYDVYKDLVSWGVTFPENIGQMAAAISPPYPNVPQGFRRIPPILKKQAQKAGAVIMNQIMVTELLQQDDKSIVGAIGFAIETGDCYVFKSKATALCGGSNSFKPPGFPIHMLTGDAEAMAYRAGAEITGKEFNCTTHPTGAKYPAGLFAIRRVGPPAFAGLYRDGLGNEVPHNKGGTAEPDLRLEQLAHEGLTPLMSKVDDPWMLGFMKHVFGEFAQNLDDVQLAGGAAAGYQNAGTGGIWVTDKKCGTGLPGLFVAGDCGGTRHNGAFIANVGNGTGPSAVTGKIAGAGAAEYALQAKKMKINEKYIAGRKNIVYAPMERKTGYNPRWVTQLLQNTMIPYFVSYIKHEARLQAAITNVEFLRDHLVPRMYAKDPHELKLVHETGNMVLAAEMILRASLFRKESRGAHFREDYPKRDDPAWLAWTKLKEVNGNMEVSKVAIPKKWWPDLSKSYEERYPSTFSHEPEK
ncbi:MAG: FAD-binding protein [Desulfatitalea sp.]|nr:FAD-binding protein [Desulfatitalea sp.]NNK02213.1 FAD-binding protein [Desulfatitalea sp.]